MTYGEAFDFCMAGGKVRATKKFASGDVLSWVIHYDKHKDQFAKQLQIKGHPESFSPRFICDDETATELDRWAFEDADPRPPFEVRAAVDDDMALCVSIFWRGGLVIGTNRDDAVQLFEALGKAITCEACGGYIDSNGECDAGKHDGSK